MLPVIGVCSLVFIPVAFVVFLVLTIRKKPAKKTWGIITLATVIVFGAAMGISIAKDGVRPMEKKEPTVSTQPPVESTTEPTVITDEPKEETAAEKFARINDIPVALAEDIEYALSQSEHSYTLNQVYQWEQIDDYAYGQRYTGYMDLEYVWVFYVRDNKVESIRQQKGLSYIYQAE